MQIDNQMLDQIAQNVLGVFDKVATTREEGIRKVREAVSEAVDHFDIVTREEFDVANRLLSNTRVKLDALEKRVVELEEALSKANGSEGEAK
ncbi:MAG: accessory factor UbiK family protein [Magnetococcales bacterium]|nr:accessory factor UbiK family protein [Magnetococcales bacterium]